MMTNDTIAKAIGDIELDAFLDVVAPLRALVRAIETYDETTSECDPSDTMLVLKTCLRQITRRAEDVHEALDHLGNLYAHAEKGQEA